MVVSKLALQSRCCYEIGGSRYGCLCLYLLYMRDNVVLTDVPFYLITVLFWLWRFDFSKKVTAIKVTKIKKHFS